jgi:hypothetical protein
MFIDPLRTGLLIDECFPNCAGGIIEIPNSERERELKKVWVDCTGVSQAALVNLEAKRRNPLCPLFRSRGDHQKVCDGIILVENDGHYHAIFCELKTSWDPIALRQIKNSYIFFEYSRALTRAWHGATEAAVTCWFAVLTTGWLPILKGGTGFKVASIPLPNRPSTDVNKPRRLRLETGKAGLMSNRPLSIKELANI